ncbi:MAG: hypothetical protein M1826_002145 [Phylliscum demangeonii]|nr:MAG: hypothetical protein M1826_002145 [Phylliscum demangeonii]
MSMLASYPPSSPSPHPLQRYVESYGAPADAHWPSSMATSTASTPLYYDPSSDPLVAAVAHSAAPSHARHLSDTPSAASNSVWSSPGLDMTDGEHAPEQHHLDLRPRGHQRVASDASSVVSAGPASPAQSTIAHPYILSVESEAAHADFFAPPDLEPYHPEHLEARIAMRTARKAPRRWGDGATSSSSGGHETRAIVPKLDRTVSDVYQDELFHPALCAPSTPTTPHRRTSSNASHLLLSPVYRVFSERIQAASQGHLQAQAQAQAQSPAASISRERSPFRQGSPYAPSVATVDASSSPRPHSPGRLGSGSGMREQHHLDADAYGLRPPPSAADEPASATTISPREAMLDYHETAEDATMPLFPPREPPPAHVTAIDPMIAVEPPTADAPNDAPAPVGPGLDVSHFSFLAPPMPSTLPPALPLPLPIPQQYPFIPRPRPDLGARASAEKQRPRPIEPTPEFPAHLTSMESSVSDEPADASSAADALTPAVAIARPARTQADSGTYTCTYHGCTLRFETHAQLQKHKRDGHRHATPAHLAAAAFERSVRGGSRSGSASHSHSRSRDGSHDDSAGLAEADDLLRNTQAGPHRCARINPATGKACNLLFSRPYDLTRHEDTIHNGRKQKVRCQHCTDQEKTFSRYDALTRHMRVVHPEVEFGARARRKLLLQQQQQELEQPPKAV